MNASLIIFSHVLTSRYRSEKREEVNKHILKEEEEKAKIQKDLSILTDRLSQINESLARKAQARNEYDKTIQETEAAYMKVRKGPSGFLFFIFYFVFVLFFFASSFSIHLRPIATHLIALNPPSLLPPLSPQPPSSRFWSQVRLCCMSSRGKLSTLPRKSRAQVNIEFHKNTEAVQQTTGSTNCPFALVCAG